MECLHPNFNQVSFVGHKWVHTSEIQLTRGEGKKHLGFARWPFPGATLGMGGLRLQVEGWGCIPTGNLITDQLFYK